jgi:hypothetical protein
MIRGNPIEGALDPGRNRPDDLQIVDIGLDPAGSVDPGKPG